MAQILTYFSRKETLKGKTYLTLDNQLCLLDNGRLAFIPRKLVTDDNTNPLGDNNFIDVRASHFHDLGCRWHSLIYVKPELTLVKLRQMGWWHLNKKRSAELGVEVYVCEDIPKCYLEIEKVGFNEINAIFKQILKACGVNFFKYNVARFAVNFNLGWIFQPKEEYFPSKNKLTLEMIYKEYV